MGFRALPLNRPTLAVPCEVPLLARSGWFIVEVVRDDSVGRPRG
jgi:hypothetical protein